MQLTWETIVTNVNWTLVINLVQFLLLVWLLNRLIYRPLLRFIHAREATLSAQRQEAQRQHAEAEALRAKQATELSQTNLHARRILEVARTEATTELARLRAEARDQAREII